MLDSRTEIRAGQRFAFGANWRAFVDTVDETRIQTATESLTRALHSPDLAGRSFLDVGCGSGLFSVAAHRLGAQVRSFDFDAESVAAATELRTRFTRDAWWPIEQGSILDERYVARLGQHDVVYSWGVLHHTGNLWRAVDLASGLVKPGGLLFVSIYNDQGLRSRIWRRVKRRYNRSGRAGRATIVLLSAGYLWRWRPLLRVIGCFRGGQPTRVRGMSARHDLVDWVGGYPFEVARPETVFEFLRDRGFELRHLKTCAGGLGCNEYVFVAPS
jgi:2-polyprenyl-6-hydroxyphenyl methylase/3-demethylubiquinone-9 3-methyltransferase